MLELTLNEAAHTIATGLVFLFGLGVAIHIVSRHLVRRTRVLLAKLSLGDRWIFAVVAIIVAFLIGMAAENLSDRSVTEAESGLRAAVLFTDDGRLTSLGRDLYDKDALDAHGMAGASDSDAVITALNSLYFQAKNKVFQDPNYFRELSLIQARINFARSLALVAGVLLFLALIGVVATVARYLNGVPALAPKNQRLALRAVIALVFSWVLCALTLSSFCREEDEFNERVFGYYNTILAGQSSPSPVYKAPEKLPLSGITQWNNGYLAVTNANRNIAPRLYNMEYYNNNFRAYPAIVDWKDLTPYKPRDVQSVCAVKSTAGSGDSVWLLESRRRVDEAAGVRGLGRLVRLVERPRQKTSIATVIYSLFPRCRFGLARAPDFCDNVLYSAPRGPAAQFIYGGHRKLPEDFGATANGMHCWRGPDDRPWFVVAENGGGAESRLRVWRLLAGEGTISKEEEQERVTLSGIVRVTGLTAEVRQGDAAQYLWGAAQGDGDSTDGRIYRVAKITSGVEETRVKKIDPPSLCRVERGKTLAGIALSANLGEFVVVEAGAGARHELARVVVGCE